uniref:Poly A polymerase head domain-containing protein n=1 Tax=Zooxanthella nutricula TaxID=1333877 RepID=A0A6V0FH82_9DINO|mmetsp:Transcript_13509/g.40140  ORF Transcript_13509/g.40140 Transcript_13509/m.40140 type:complete len:455 (+) Transcript_13509:93-1457(+)
MRLGVLVRCLLAAAALADPALARSDNPTGTLEFDAEKPNDHHDPTPDAAQKHESPRLRKQASSFSPNQGVKAGPAPDAWEYEKRYFLRLPAVEAAWHKTVKYTKFERGDDIVKSVDDVKRGHVPGLNGITFGEVFRVFEQGGCPIWLQGGVVRDILAGDRPKDVDVAPLCEMDQVRQIISRARWQSSLPEPESPSTHWEVGDKSDPRCLEGFSLEVYFTDISKADTSVSMLLWSVGQDRLIDPSGNGKDDAERKLLRPALPAGRGSWMDWYTGGNRRLLRYWRMRMRPHWWPFDECFRAFMLSRLLAQDLERSKTPELTHFVHESLAKHGEDKVAWVKKLRRSLTVEATRVAKAKEICPWQPGRQAALDVDQVVRSVFSVLVDTCSLSGIQDVLLRDVFHDEKEVPRGGPVLMWLHMFGPEWQGPRAGKTPPEALRLFMVGDNCRAISEALSTG